MSKREALAPKKARPSEKVRKFVLEEFVPTGGSMRLPTMRDLAERLDVSVATVQLVYSQLKAEGRLSTRIGDGTFLVREPASQAHSKTQLNIVLNYLPSQEEMDVSDLGKIYGAMLHAGMQPGRKVSFAPLRALSAPVRELETLSGQGDADGIIIFPTGSERDLVQSCERNGIPYVCLQPPFPEANRNFVSAQHFTPGHAIGCAFAAGGRSRVAFFASGQPTRSTSSWEILSGMTCGLIEGSGRSEISFFESQSHRARTPEELDADVARWLEERRDALPDAIFCHRVPFAISTVKAMTALGLKAPEDYALITHDDVFAPVQKIQVTNMGAPLVDIGRALVNMLLQRIDNQNQALPPIRIPSLFGSGQTTSPAENEVLGIKS